MKKSKGRGRPPSGKITASFRLNPKTFEKLKATAKKLGQDNSVFVERAIINQLKVK